MKVSGCSFSFSAKEKEPKRKLAAYVLFFESLCLGWASAIRRFRRRQEKGNGGFITAVILFVIARSWGWIVRWRDVAIS
jgi:hypothetical protein